MRLLTRFAGQQGTNVLSCATYVSKVNFEMSMDNLEPILETAKRNNAKNGLTGVLLFNKTYFIQSLEGSRPKINRLLKNLSADPRHSDMQIIEFKDILVRSWGQWSMGYSNIGTALNQLEQTTEGANIDLLNTEQEIIQHLIDVAMSKGLET